MLAICLSTYIVSYKGKFKIEFGESVGARNEFVQLLNEHGISSEIETDHLGRVWIVPDQTKRAEYEVVNRIWEERHREEVRKYNEDIRL